MLISKAIKLIAAITIILGAAALALFPVFGIEAGIGAIVSGILLFSIATCIDLLHRIATAVEKLRDYVGNIPMSAFKK